jgi:hypothetical protein
VVSNQQSAVNAKPQAAIFNFQFSIFNLQFAICNHPPTAYHLPPSSSADYACQAPLRSGMT